MECKVKTIIEYSTDPIKEKLLKITLNQLMII